MINVFSFLKEIMCTKSDLDFNDHEVYSSYNIYMINRYLSMIEMYLPIINMVNNGQLLSKKDHYEFLKNIVPRNNIMINYIKKKKCDDASITTIAKHLQIGINEARLYNTIMTKESIKNINQLYNDGKVSSDSKNKM